MEIASDSNKLTSEFKVKLIIKSDEKYCSSLTLPKGLTAMVTVRASNCTEAINTARSIFAISSEIKSMICSKMDSRDKWRFITDLKKMGINFNEYCLSRNKECQSPVELIGLTYPNFCVATYKDDTLPLFENLTSIKYINCPHELCGSKSDFECTISRIVKQEIRYSMYENNPNIQLVYQWIDNFIEDNVTNWIQITQLDVIQLCENQVSEITFI